jgi:ATP-dependent helicase/nuclease subunit B
LEFLRNALRIARSDWHGDSVMSLVKTGLAGITADEADALENYVLLHRVRGQAWESPNPWVFQRKLTLYRDEEATAAGISPANEIDILRRRIAAGLAPLVAALREGRALAVRELATHVFSLFERFNVRQTLATWIADAAARPASGAASNLDQSAEHEQVWAELAGLFEELVDLFGEHRLTPNDFVEVLEAGLERFDLALAPPTVDQVLVGQVDRTICPAVRAAFVLGLSEGEFPAIPRDQTVLSDRERRELARRRIELDPDGRRRLLDEPLLGYLAFTRASQRLFISRPLADDKGRPTTPSVFWKRISQLFPSVESTMLPPRRIADVEQISTPRQLVTGIMRWVRTTHARREADGSWPALYQWLAKRPACGDSIDRLRRAAWPSLRYANQASLSEPINRALFPPPLSAGVSQLETFAACPFRHFARHGLRLESRRDQDVTMADLSQVYHKVLEELINQAIGSESRPVADPMPITDEMIRAATDRVGHTLRGEFMLSNARNRYLLHRVERTLRQLIASQRELMNHSKFRPEMAGVSFGAAGPLPALELTTPQGAKVSLEGKIDRIDTLPGGDQVIAFDYRLAVGPLSLQKVHYGLSLQLLTHLLVLEAYGQQLAGRSLKPSAAFYLQLLRSLGDVDHPDEALDPDDPRYLLALKPRGIFDGRALGALDTELSEGRSMAIAAYVNKQGGFGYRGSTDVADGAEFSALLLRVRERIGTLADQIIAGRIEVTPFRLSTESPCPRCEFRGVCRFETSVNHYTILEPLGREQVLERAREQAQRE